MTPPPRASSPLADRAYRRLFAAQVSSLVGTGLTTVALALLAHDLAGGDAGAVLGTVLALKMVIYVLVAPVVGGLAHRLPRKSFLIGLDLVRVAIVLALPFISSLWQIYVLVALLNIAAAGFTPTFQATIPDVLPDEARYTRALSLARLAYDLENLASPSLAALALLFVSYDGLFVFDAVTFVVSALLIAATPIPRAAAPGRSEGRLGELTFGLRAYLRTPRLRSLLALHFAAAAGGAMVIVNTVVLVQDQLGASATVVAWALAASGAGSMVVALATPRALTRTTERAWMTMGALLLTATLFASSLLPASLATLLSAWFAIGLGSSAIQTPAGRLVRRSCAAEDRPALFSAEFALSHVSWLVAYPVAGLVGAEYGMRPAFAAVAALAGLGALVAAVSWPRRDGVPLTHEHQLAHSHRHVHDAHHRHDHETDAGPEPHTHPHVHGPMSHRHEVHIDLHHPRWPREESD